MKSSFCFLILSIFVYTANSQIVYLDSTYSWVGNISGSDLISAKVNNRIINIYPSIIVREPLGTPNPYTGFNNILTINNLGDTLFTQRYYDDSTFLKSININYGRSDNELLLVGLYYKNIGTDISPLSVGYSTVLSRLDTFGNITTIYKSSNDTFISGEDITVFTYSVSKTTDNLYLINCIRQSIILNYRNILAIYIDSSGNEVNRIQYYSPYVTTANKVIATKDSGLLYVGVTEHFGEFAGPAAYLMKTDKSGIKKWEKDFRFYFNYDPDYTFDAIASNIKDVLETDDGFIVCGVYDDTLTHHKPGYPPENPAVETDPVRRSWIAKLDKDSGNIIWSSRFGIDSTAYQFTGLNSIVASNDGGFVSCGFFKRFIGMLGFYNANIIKVDSLGNKVWEYIIPIDSQLYKHSGDEDNYYLNNIFKIDGGYMITGVHSYRLTYPDTIIDGSFPYVLTLDEGGCNTYNCHNIDTDTLNTDNLNLYPNPCEDYMMLAYDSYPDTMVGLSIFNVLGELIVNENIDDARHHLINTSSFAKGLYILQITQGGKVRKTRKFVKV